MKLPGFGGGHFSPTVRSVRGVRGRRRSGRNRRDGRTLGGPLLSFHLVLAVFFLLLGFGLMMVLASSSVVSYRREGSSFGVFNRQVLFAAVGMVGFCVALRVKIGWLRAMSAPALLVSLGMLVLVLGMPSINGARSWIRLGALGFQPSELAKFSLMVWGAHVLACRRHSLGSWRALLVPVLPVSCLIGVLIMLEPDLGTTVSLLVIVFALLFFAGASWMLFAILAGLGVAGVLLLALTSGYRYARIMSFVDPEADPQGSGLQLLQGLYGMADGGLFGVGLGQSRAKWSYLPNPESDFIFAIVGEELGLVGSLLLVGLFAMVAAVGLRIARRNRDVYVKLVAATASTWLVGQAGINILYVVGLLPVTGIPLPLISAGGTSLVVTMTIFGLLANFARHEPAAVHLLPQVGDPGAFSQSSTIGALRTAPLIRRGPAAPLTLSARGGAQRAK